MYDATEKARRVQQWALNAKLAEGKIEGKIELIRTFFLPGNEGENAGA